MTEPFDIDNPTRAVFKWRLTRFVQAPSTSYLFCAYPAVAASSVVIAYILFCDSLESALLGKLIHHVLFCFLLASAWIVGPLLAGHRTIRDRRTRAWEALALSPVKPRVVATGEAIGANLELWVLHGTALPLSVVAWLLNGPDVWELCLAWGCALINASVSVFTGLWLASSRTSVLQLFVFGTGVATLTLPALGFGGSLVMSALAPSVSAGWPVWLPSAWRSIQGDWAWLLTLVWLPSVIVATYLWVAFEMVTANLTHPILDRSCGLRRWHLWTSVPIWTAALIPRLLVDPSETWRAYAWSVLALLTYGWLCSLLFAYAPSRRELRKPTATFTVRQALLRCLAVSGIQLTALALVGFTEALWIDEQPVSISNRLALSCLFAFSFLAMSTGTLVWLRERRTVRFSRLVYAAFSMLVLVVPIAASATLTLMRRSGASWIAAFIPAWGLVPIETWPGDEPSRQGPILAASFVCLGLGVTLWRATGRKERSSGAN